MDMPVMKDAERICALLVDDDDVDRERLARLLNKCCKNVEVMEAASKENAIKLLRSKEPRFTFIFLDFKLADGDGRDLLPEIWEKVGADCVVIAVTGYGGEYEAADAIKLGIHEYLSKKDLSELHVSKAIDEGLSRVEAMRRVRAEEDDLRHKSTHDDLTDLPNRHVFFDRLEQRCVDHRRSGNSFAVMMIDLDKFKQVNDEHGHAIGDQVLVEASKRLKEAIREIDTVARLGGDEFAAIFPGVHSLNVAQSIANKLSTSLRQPMMINGNTMVSVGASVGVAVCPQHGNSADTLLRRADEAMYRGKRSVDKVVLYDDLEPRSTNFLERLVLLGELELALGRGDIQWHWQPKVDLTTRRVLGFETLARWSHPSHGPVPTDVFIAAIESSPLILPFTLATAENVIRQVSELGSVLEGLRVSFNVSARVLEHADFVDELIARIDSAGIDPQRVVIELTETALIGSPTKAVEVINRLNAHGLVLSIDDFGAGFTSFGYLRDFNVKEIKIDKSYVLRLTDNQFDRSLVSCLAVFCDSLGINLVAEGVETDACWQTLLSLGCRFGQGFHFGHPMPADAVAGWLEDWRDRACDTR